MIDKFPCRKCGRTLPRSGEVAVNGVELPVFQCDEGIVEAEMYGEQFETALTFAVGADGKPFDPATEDGDLHLLPSPGKEIRAGRFSGNPRGRSGCSRYASAFRMAGSTDALLGGLRRSPDRAPTGGAHDPPAGPVPLLQRR